jgi:hypothetical protein
MSRVVRAAAVSVNSKNKEQSKLIEKAMSEAILQCFAEGITDPVEQKKRMLEARDTILK